MRNSNAAEASTAIRPSLRAMFAARKRVFVDMLGWDVPVLAGQYEVDQFDTETATYLVLSDRTGSHRASARLLRTDGAHILGDLFPVLSASAVPTGESIREITRFCIDPSLSRSERQHARNQLVSALVEHALANEISAYTAVANANWARQISAFGWDCSALGPSRQLCGETLVGLKILIDESTPASLASTGIYCATSFEVAESLEAA